MFEEEEAMLFQLSTEERNHLYIDYDSNDPFNVFDSDSNPNSVLMGNLSIDENNMAQNQQISQNQPSNEMVEEESDDCRSTIGFREPYHHTRRQLPHPRISEISQNREISLKNTDLNEDNFGLGLPRDRRMEQRSDVRRGQDAPSIAPKKQKRIKKSERAQKQGGRTKKEKNSSQSTLQHSQRMSDGQQTKRQLPQSERQKNVPHNSFKVIVNAYVSEEYSKIFDRLCVEYGVIDRQHAKSYYTSYLIYPISLKFVQFLLDYQRHRQGDDLRSIKQAFLHFYVWFMRRRYTLHIVKARDDNMLHKADYLRMKNILISLPNLKGKAEEERRMKMPKNQQEIISIFDFNLY